MVGYVINIIVDARVAISLMYLEDSGPANDETSPSSTEKHLCSDPNIEVIIGII